MLNAANLHRGAAYSLWGENEIKDLKKKRKGGGGEKEEGKRERKKTLDLNTKDTSRGIRGTEAAVSRLGGDRTIGGGIALSCFFSFSFFPSVDLAAPATPFVAPAL